MSESFGDIRCAFSSVEHHLAHTASSFFQSGIKSAAGLTIDGSGDFVSCMMSDCHQKYYHIGQNLFTTFIGHLYFAFVNTLVFPVMETRVK